MVPILPIWRLLFSNRFIYSEEYKRRRNLDHDGQNAMMFAGKARPYFEVTMQTEEVADARWFVINEASDMFPVAKQPLVFLSCIEEMRQFRQSEIDNHANLYVNHT